MTNNRTWNFSVSAFVIGIVIGMMMPLVAWETSQGVTALQQASSAPEGSVKKITEYVLMQKAVAKEGSYEPYLSELRIAKEARENGDWIEQYQSMTRFIDKLDTREGGISAGSARDIRDYTYLVSLVGSMR